uniref:ATP synthase complex subunit 8 n=2 Tax=Nemacheilidae TaxID=278171 RepID=A0A0U3DWB5_9TELE|nr:ATP synthase F0 subunit 8 [Claea dabryi]YP_009630643.1 ATP synthase F0 subunit 8 [Yunnanilus sichuanensis]YP_010835057.1 ATP synthase F0 subunit 8 [Triplophysa jianchuanensis]AMD12135.1 ATP synthase F0 subunit 8 [Triplophysa sp. 1 YW-2016]ALT55453.1 ATP synthase F0 subunit 8 [Claea dabryi]QBR55201.1 ATP synthase F0 subunit 8 [Yunnanilus sichuanensis]WFQ82732.1 ATP synthase F0 subunit 8 [Triplophysa jianchuanensis]
MPQLNPAPWFAILVFSWLVFLTIIPTKVMSHTSPNEPMHIDSEEHKTEPWDWPWQ